MKNLKAVIMIILGSFVLATGFAFAGDNAYRQLNSDPFTTHGDGEMSPTNKSFTPPTVNKAEETAPAPKPTVGERVKGFIHDNKKTMFMGAFGAYVGYVMIGTVAGALTFGLGAVLILAIAMA